MGIERGGGGGGGEMERNGGKIFSFYASITKGRKDAQQLQKMRSLGNISQKFLRWKRVDSAHRKFARACAIAGRGKEASKDEKENRIQSAGRIQFQNIQPKIQISLILLEISTQRSNTFLVASRHNYVCGRKGIYIGVRWFTGVFWRETRSLSLSLWFSLFLSLSYSLSLWLSITLSFPLYLSNSLCRSLFALPHTYIHTCTRVCWIAKNSILFHSEYLFSEIYKQREKMKD